MGDQTWVRARSTPAVRVPGVPGLPPTLTRDVPGVVVPLLLAVVLGLACGLAPVATLVALAALAVLALLLWRVELAALVLVLVSIAGATLEDSLASRAQAALAAVLVAAWVVHRARDPLPPARSDRVLRVLVLLAAVAWLVCLPLGAGRDVLVALVVLVVLLVLVDVLRGPLSPRLAVQSYVAGSALVAVAGGVVALVRVLGDADLASVLHRPALGLVLVAAVALALVLREDTSMPWLADLGAGACLLGIAGSRSWPALCGLGAVLVVGLLTRAVRPVAAVGAVAVLLVAAGVAGVVAPDLLDPRGPGTAREWLLGREELTTPAGVQLVLLALVVAVGLVSAWRRRRRGPAPLAAAVGLAVAGLVVTGSLATGRETWPLWGMAALGWALAPAARGVVPVEVTVAPQAARS